MEISIQKTNQLKSVAILMMLCLHLFNQDYHGLFQPLLFVGSQPLSYYVSLFCDACVPIFAFVSGYGLF
jgi:surface polysaccharide O-acyltransferase-like enzyme